MTHTFRDALYLSPVTAPNARERTRADFIVREVVHPVLSSLCCNLTRVDYLHGLKNVPEKVDVRIASADLIVADLTRLDPSVLLQLGKCDFLGIPFVLLAADPLAIPSSLGNNQIVKIEPDRLSDPTYQETCKTRFAASVKKLADFKPKVFPAEAMPRLLARLPLTIVDEVFTGRRDHYRIAQALVEKGPNRLLLMQRSSTLLLGPEAGWGDEAAFFEAVWSSVRSGTQLFHVVSQEGIKRHLERVKSHFPQIQEAQERLVDLDGVVGIPRGEMGEPVPMKRIPEERNDPDLKPDRQARVLIGDFGDDREAVVVMDLGGNQVCLSLRGPGANALFYFCVDFHNDCPPLTWKQVGAICGTSGPSPLTLQEAES